jgi:membrane associated rhomboid family serine protease
MALKLGRGRAGGLVVDPRFVALMGDLPSVWENFKRYPVSLGVCAVWVLLFVAMSVWQGGLQGGKDMLTTGIRPGVGHLFGDQKPADLRAWQLWRAVTATCVHFSLVHLLFNLILMYQLGPIIESWYGSRLCLAIYAFIGFAGNLIAGLARLFGASAAGFLDHPAGGVNRWVFASAPGIESGGGSSVLCGLIALLAVVGWRSRTRFGDFLRGQMVGFLVFTAIFGLVVEGIDNYGHAGGALVGALVGLVHKPLLRAAGDWRATMAATVAVVVCLACAGLQVRAGVREAAPLRRQQSAQKRELARQIVCDLLTVRVLFAAAAEYPHGRFDQAYALQRWVADWQDPQLKVFVLHPDLLFSIEPGDDARRILADCGDRLARARNEFASRSQRTSLDRLLGLIARAAAMKATSADERECLVIVQPLIAASGQRLLKLGAREAVPRVPAAPATRKNQP